MGTTRYDQPGWFGPLAGGSGQPLLFTYSLIVAILCGTMGLPHILVRFYTNPDARAARRTAWLVLVLVGLFVFGPERLPNLALNLPARGHVGIGSRRDAGEVITIGVIGVLGIVVD